MRMGKQRLTGDEAEALALRALGFLAADAARIGRFLRLTGISPDVLREQAGEPAVLVAVLEHLLADQSLLLVFSAEAATCPSRLEEARALLSGIGNPGVWL
jgi:hypothetical protein